MDGLFDTIAGLPMHPLLVHAPVVLPRRPWSHLSDHAPLAAEIES